MITIIRKIRKGLGKFHRLFPNKMVEFLSLFVLGMIAWFIYFCLKILLIYTYQFTLYIDNLREAL